MPPKLFSFIQFRKNTSATPLVSHTFKTKDLKPFRFTHLQKNGGVPFMLSPAKAAMRTRLFSPSPGLSKEVTFPQPRIASHKSPITSHFT